VEQDSSLQRLLKQEGPRTEAPAGVTLLCAIDRFSFFQGHVHIAGWAVAPGQRVEGLELRFPSGAGFALRSYGQASSDVAAVHGAEAAHVRFDEMIAIDQPQQDVPAARLVVAIAGHAPAIVSDFGMPGREDPGVRIQHAFAALIRSRPAGRLLEIGSRARSGVTRRDLAPEGWSYTGLDAVAGDNVDVVGDAHALSRLFSPASFDAVAAYSVIEHLLMPWKFAVELNRVLSPGAVGLITTHQCWPLHDTPADYWRFSDTAWAALFNRATGYEILQTALGSPTLVVPIRCNPFTNFGGPPASFLASSVLFRKSGETTLDWPVEVDAG
jgi:hypothetical protein